MIWKNNGDPSLSINLYTLLSSIFYSLRQKVRRHKLNWYIRSASNDIKDEVSDIFQESKNAKIIRHHEEGKGYYILTTLLGEGGAGKIYNTYYVSKSKIEYCVSKIFKNPELNRNRIKEALLIQKQHEPFDSNIYKYRNSFTTFSKFILGKHPTKENLRQYSFVDRISIVIATFLAADLLHNETPTTGYSVLHGDIKVENMHFWINSKGRVEVRFFDFDSSFRLSSSDDKTTRNCNYFSPISSAPEILLGRPYNTKSDIYSLSIIVSKMLGIEMSSYRASLKNKYKKKRTGWWRGLLQDRKLNHFALSPINFDNKKVFANQEDKKFSADIYRNVSISKLIIKFLKQMQNVEYDNRPNSTVCLRFFMMLDSLYKDSLYKTELKKITDEYEHANTLLAKLILLANGFWEQKIDVLPYAKRLLLGSSETELIPGTFETYDLNSHPKLCNKIITNRNNLTMLQLSEWLREEENGNDIVLPNPTPLQAALILQPILLDSNGCEEKTEEEPPNPQEPLTSMTPNNRF